MALEMESSVYGEAEDFSSIWVGRSRFLLARLLEGIHSLGFGGIMRFCGFLVGFDGVLEESYSEMNSLGSSSSELESEEEVRLLNVDWGCAEEEREKDTFFMVGFFLGLILYPLVPFYHMASRISSCRRHFNKQMAGENSDRENPPQSESLHLKTLAEQKYVAGNLKSALKYAKRAHRLHPSLDGVEEMLTAFEILRTASVPISPAPTDNTTSATPAPPDYYKILQIERFAHINIIKKQYRKLALALHPDKNPFAASEEAFKYVGEGFRVLSDRIRRKEYDMKLRIAMQNEAEAAAGGVEVEEIQTFWTACSTCRLLHKFERKYLGHILVCPSCKKNFKAEEVVDENAGPSRVEVGEEELKVDVRSSKRTKARKAGKMSTVGEVLERLRRKNVERKRKMGEKDLENVGKKRGLRTNEVGDLEVIEGLSVKVVALGLENVAEERRLRNSGDGVIERLRSRSGRKEEIIGEVEAVKGMRTRSKSLKVVEEETMTLAEMQMLVKKKLSVEKLKGKEQGKDKKEMEEDSKKREEMDKVEKGEESQVNGKDIENENMEEEEDENEEVEMEEAEETGEDRGNKKQKLNKKRKMGVRRVKRREKKDREGVSDDESLAILIRESSRSNGDLSIEKPKRSRRNNLPIVGMHDSDFYDFDEDRAERSFKKSQVWAIYDSEDGMPRHYGLIDDVISLDPFEVRLSWLEFQSSGDHQLVSWEKMGFYVSCGRFKVSEKATVKSVKMFSHLVNCERAAREVYRIYPKKGSVWAMYNEHALHSERDNQTTRDKSCYDIVVFLTSYSDIHGSSFAYLEKVDGFKTTFKRREIGAHAISFLEKDEFKLLSHQIPGRKLSGEEAPGLPKYCWELDPASLPPDALPIGGRDTIAS